jgi:Flp pilus assembly protein TadD
MGRLGNTGRRPEMTPAFRLLLDPAEGTAEQESTGAVVLALRDSPDTDAKEFLAAFRRAVHLEPNDPDYHYILGDALSRLGRHREALPALREAVLMSSSDAAYHYALGVVLWNLGSYEEAAQALGEAERLRPDDPATLTALGAALVAAGRQNEAAGTLQRALRLDGKRSAPHSNLGAALWGLGRRADALRALGRAVQIEPSSPELRRNLAQAQLAADQPEEAIASFRQALRLRPDAESKLDLADALHACGRDAEARDRVDEALRLDPGCLRDRQATRERHDAVRIADMRDELALEARQANRLWAASRTAVFAVLFALSLGFRKLIPRLGVAGTMVSYLGLAALAYSIWLFVPPYVDYFILKDRLAEVAGAPLEDDALVLERLLHAVRERGMEAQVREESCQIETRPRWRIIQCAYAAPIRFMPGLEHELRFRLRVEKPYLSPGKTLFASPGRS